MNTALPLPRLFYLQRDHDVTGVSGTGRVANGVLWPDGTVTLRWVGDRPSTVHWDRLDDAEAIHGHGGATRIVWADEQPPADQAALRDRIAEALLDYLSRTADIRPGRTGELAFMPEVTDAERLGMAAAVLAVLPEPAVQAAAYEESARTAEEIADRLHREGATERAQGAYDVMDVFRKASRMATTQTPALAVEAPKDGGHP
ncbi:hypothetical protein [Streptomyces viridosporus]|uniref:hypothetical protein n=1 Tax=Streptomyces viridosporus TaxID=67581 RepID=UPI0036F5FD38